MVDRHYPLVDRIVLIMDQLNTHSPASLSTAFPSAEAKRLADKLEIHLTLKHGSWLNMAELERIVLQRQCLRQRLPNRAAMEREVGAWSRRRNDQITRVDWQCTTDDARTNLRRLYPAFED